MLEVRGHARGGQGMVTAFEILAKVYCEEDNFQVQAFPFFGVERTGAPIQAFFRVSGSAINNRSNIYHPNFIVVFDETVIDMVPVFDGLQDKGVVLLNTEQPAKKYSTSFAHIYTVPATAIALDMGLGSQSLPIVNAAMIGAMIRIMEGNLTLAKEVIKANVPAKPDANAEAAEKAYHSVQNLDDYRIRPIIEEQGTNDHLLSSTNGTPKPAPDDYPDIPGWNKPMSLNKTGSWRVMTPRYSRRNAPCTHFCPAGTDVREFVKKTGESSFREAYDVIVKHNPFPSACGRVCPHFCQQGCNRNTLDDQLNIGAIERFLGDRFSSEPVNKTPLTEQERVAVIGGGPAGLTCALRLREKGYAVTVFEAAEKAGGMMRTGIPAFRLPDEALDKEIKRIENAGVEIICSSEKTIEDLQNKFDLVVVATGQHLGRPLGVNGEDLAIDGIRFLREQKEMGSDLIESGDRVAVIGGGNTAIDVARTAIRKGAKPTIYYRRTQEEMPAITHEVEEARHEGVDIEFLCAPISIEQDGCLKLSLTKMELGNADDTGRRRPVPVDGSHYTIEVDKVVKAIGQSNDLGAFSKETNSFAQGMIEYDAQIPVFCCGDMAWGGTVTEAIGSGNMAADEVYASLNKTTYQPPELDDYVHPAQMNYNYYIPKAKHRNPVLTEGSLTGNFDETVLALPENIIVEEAGRCLHCGDCFECGNCFNYCPDAAIHRDEQGNLYVDYEYCKGCGICYNECPCGAITFDMETETEIA